MSAELFPMRLVGRCESSPLAFFGGRMPSALMEAQSPEARIIERAYGCIDDHYWRPVSRLRTDPVRRFYDLVWTWRIETATLSDADLVCTHPAYQQIIGMGVTALPFIFRELETDDGYWYWALKAITGNDPVPEDDRGRIPQMKEHWLQWAHEHGLA